MGYCQRGQAPGHGSGLEPPRLAMFDIGHEPRSAGGQANPALFRRETRVAVEIDGQRLDAGGGTRLQTFLDGERDQSRAFARQFLEQGDELGFAILRGPGPPMGQSRLARRQNRHDLRRHGGLGLSLTLCARWHRQGGFRAHGVVSNIFPACTYARRRWRPARGSAQSPSSLAIGSESGVIGKSDPPKTADSAEAGCIGKTTQGLEYNGKKVAVTIDNN